MSSALRAQHAAVLRRLAQQALQRAKAYRTAGIRSSWRYACQEAGRLEMSARALVRGIAL